MVFQGERGMKLEPEVRADIRKMAVGCLVCTLITALVLFLAGQRKLPS